MTYIWLIFGPYVRPYVRPYVKLYVRPYVKLHVRLYVRHIWLRLLNVTITKFKMYVNLYFLGI